MLIKYLDVYTVVGGVDIEYFLIMSMLSNDKLQGTMTPLLVFHSVLFIPRHRWRDIVLALSVRLSVRPALLCPELYLGSALVDFIETWFEYIYG